MNSLKDFLFISIPEKLSASIKDLGISPSLLLPVENKYDNIETLIQNLSWEMIIASMLNVMIIDPTHKDIPAYRKIIKKVKPNLVEELTQAAYAKRTLKDFDFAEDIFKILTIYDPEDAVSKLNLALLYDDRAMLYHDTENFKQMEIYVEKAKTIFDEMMESPSPLLQTYYYSALFYARTQEEEKAKKYLNIFIDRASDDMKDKIEKALKILDVIKSEEKASQLFAEAHKKIMEEDEKGALLVIDELLSLSSDAWNVWFLKGWAHRRLKQFEEGAAAFEKALTLEKSNSELYNELAICYMELNLLEKAKGCLDEALKIAPNDIKILSNYAILSLKLNRIEEANETFAKVLELDPEEPLAKKFFGLD